MEKRLQTSFTHQDRLGVIRIRNTTWNVATAKGDDCYQALFLVHEHQQCSLGFGFNKGKTLCHVKVIEVIDEDL